MRWLLLTGIALVTIGLTWSWLSEPEGPQPLSPRPELRRVTEAGPVIGGSAGAGVSAWLGVPYAAPPVGDLRWRKPEPHQPFPEPLQAVDHGAPCPQLDGLFAPEPADENGLLGSEDCLTLNIHAPADTDSAGADLPVMVWIHGGGNVAGGSGLYDPSQLVSEQRVVVVTLNYRLGIFGWFSHAALRGAAADPLSASGNFGLLDILQALRWVQANISAFGGDPGNVTVFGESAGGRNIFGLLVSPLAEGLFHRAIIQSGSPATSPLTRAEHRVDQAKPGHRFSSTELLLRWLQATERAADRSAAIALLDSLADADVMAFLRSLPAAELLGALPPDAGTARMPQLFRDGVVLPEQTVLSRLARPDGWNAVPVMTGTNRDEQKLFLVLDPRYVKRWLGVFPRVLDPSRYETRARLFSDRWKTFAVDEAARAMTASGAGVPVYAYRFDWDESRSSWLADLPLLLGAAHGLELDFLFAPKIFAPKVRGIVTEENRAQRERLGRAMRSYWAEFARSGDPAGGGDGALPRWPQWQGDDPQLLRLDTPVPEAIGTAPSTLSVPELRRRVTSYPGLDGVRPRCALYVELFLANGGMEDFFDLREYQSLGCGQFPPWRLSEAP